MGGCQSCGRYEEDEEQEAVGEGAELVDTGVARRNMELVTIIQSPPHETMEAAELEGESKALIEKKKLRDLRWAEREKLDCAVEDGDGPKRTLAASKDKRSKMPHRDLQVSRAKGHGEYVERMPIGLHH